MHQVFIYGTLKRGFPNHQAGLAEARFVARVQTLKPFPLVIGGRWFSPYLIDEPGQGQKVFGELFEVDGDGLALLDEMEGVGHPQGYRRISVRCWHDEQALEAWTYVKDRAVIEGIHSEALAEYEADPRYVIPSHRSRVF